jgi:hypothetical protein
MLWYVVAYIVVVFGLLWLGQHFAAPSTPQLGWSE